MFRIRQGLSHHTRWYLSVNILTNVAKGLILMEYGWGRCDHGCKGSCTVDKCNMSSCLYVGRYAVRERCAQQLCLRCSSLSWTSCSVGGCHVGAYVQCHGTCAGRLVLQLMGLTVNLNYSLVNWKVKLYFWCPSESWTLHIPNNCSEELELPSLILHIEVFGYTRTETSCEHHPGRIILPYYSIL